LLVNITYDDSDWLTATHTVISPTLTAVSENH